MSGGGAFDVDLARQALFADRGAAGKNGATCQKPKRGTGTGVRRDGCESLGLGSEIDRMMTDCARYTEECVQDAD
ncbi:hypothetical protein ACIRD0_38055 [Streptomyces microflavus]|uniref:hypothetical protein n=1 Tax=Streptomyces microflavus TaxID=1919 RepID=UPI00381B3AB0